MEETTPAAVEDVEPDQWRRLHGLSPLLNAWAAIAALFSIVALNNIQTLSELPWDEMVASRGWLFVLAIIAGGLLVIAIGLGAYSWLAWSRCAYAVTDEAVWYREGILFRKQRMARLERIQAVDTLHPILGRLLGLGKISVEVAGGSGSSIDFGYLKKNDLETLRAEIMRSAALAAEGDNPEHLPPTAATGRPIFHVSWKQLAASVLFSAQFAWAFLMLIFGVAAAVIMLATGIDGVWGVLATAPLFLVGLVVIGNQFGSEFNFRAYLVPQGIRVTRGLLDTRSQVIPPRRVHAVQISQPLMWRLFGWYRVTMNQAGYGLAGGSDSEVLLPVGTREQAQLALWLVLPDLGVDDPIAFLDEVLDGTGPTPGFVSLPRRSRWLSPWCWRRRALALTDTCMVIRDGRLTRLVKFAPYGRFQSLTAAQGPLQRALGLATLRADHVPGLVALEVENLDPADAAAALRQLNQRAADVRYQESPRRWRERIETVPELGPQPDRELQGVED